MSTTGGFTTSGLLQEELLLTLPKLDVADAMEIGEIAKSFGTQKGLPIAVEVRIGDWIMRLRQKKNYGMALNERA